MKKIDKLIISSFLGPFILTFMVVVFILLTQHMLKYFDDIIGKDLGWDVLGTLLFYFAIFMTPIALPLAVLLSSLITYGNLGEHFELTAVKSLGISLVRSLFPIFIFVLILTGAAFYANNNLVPKAALEAYSLLYDIKQKKPALDLREGTFYSSIPDISIKVNDKLPDGQTLKDIIIYDHRNRIGNREVTIADSGKMYTILNDQYLKLELFNGYNYNEGAQQGHETSGRPESGLAISKTKFDKSQIVFDLSSFGLNRTDKKWFQGNRIMRNLNELQYDMDSISSTIKDQQLNLFTVTRNQIFAYVFKQDTVPIPKELREHQARKDSISKVKAVANQTEASPGFRRVDAGVAPMPDLTRPKSEPISDSARAIIAERSERFFTVKMGKAEVSAALSHARQVKTQMVNYGNQVENFNNEYRIFQVQWHKILSSSFACIVMFLIGAPLGAIIKRGGLGIPVLASILFFIVFYLLSMMGEKWSKAGLIPVPIGIWMADAILFGVGLLFLRQARVDARLFDADFYNVVWDRVKGWLRRKNLISHSQA